MKSVGLLFFIFLITGCANTTRPPTNMQMNAKPISTAEKTPCTNATLKHRKRSMAEMNGIPVVNLMASKTRNAHA